MKRRIVLFPVRTNFIIPKFFAIFVRHLLLIFEIYDKAKIRVRFYFVYNLRS